MQSPASLRVLVILSICVYFENEQSRAASLRTALTVHPPLVPGPISGASKRQASNAASPRKWRSAARAAAAAALHATHALQAQDLVLGRHLAHAPVLQDL